MKRSMFGLVVLAAATGLSCNGDPTETIRDGERITATPSAVFVDQGSTEFVTVQLVDGQGNQLAADFEVQNIGAGITVVEDPTYLQTTNGERLTTSSRFIVGGVNAASTTFVLTAGGVSDTVPVRVVPAGAGIPFATVSSTGPNPSDPTVLTVPAPFLFPAHTTIAFPVGAAAEMIPGIVTDLSSDGRSLTVLPPPGASGTGSATIVVDYLPTVDIETTTDVPVTVGTVAAVLPGTDAPATAPTINLVGGVQGGVLDGNGGYAAATCGGNSGVPCQLYKFTLAAEANVDMEMRWSNEADLGLYILTEDGTADTDQACDEHGRGAGVLSQPEHCLLHLPAGTYLAGAVNFGPFYAENDPNPDWVSLRIVTSEP